MKIVVDKENIRIDKYLGEVTDYSRSLVEKMLEEKVVLVNDKTVKASYRVCIDDVIFVPDDYVKEVKLEKMDLKLDILYEDEHLMVINKPSGLVVHPGSGNQNNTLVNALIGYTDNLSDEGGLNRTGIVHRLDKDTSGIMLVAKTNKTHELLADDFKNKRIKREYIALLKGVFPSQNAKINAPIGKSKEDFRKQEVREGGKSAVTNLSVIKRFKKYTLVRLSLETGRTHQIRVHMNYIGYPVFNDPVYTTDKCTSFGQFLHSTSIEFIHPITSKKMFFEQKIPAEMEWFIAKLD